MDINERGIVSLLAGTRDIGNISIGQSLKVEGAGPQVCKLRGSIKTDTVGSWGMEGFTLEPLDANEYGVLVPAGRDPRGCFLSWMDIVGYQVGLWLDSGNQWDLFKLYLCGCVTGVHIANNDNPDCGDNGITRCTFAPGDKQGAAGIRHYSGGGLQVMSSKFLGGQFGYWGNFDKVTSDLQICNSSFELQSDYSIYLKARSLEEYVFSNVTISNCQFMGNGVPIYLENIPRVTIDNIVLNNPKGPAVRVKNCKQVNVSNVCGDFNGTVVETVVDELPPSPPSPADVNAFWDFWKKVLGITG